MNVDQISSRVITRLQGVEFTNAELCNFSFGKHVHLDYHVGIVTRGAQLYRSRKGEETVGPGSLALVNPDEVHDGVALNEQGYSLHVLKLEPEYLQTVLADFSGQPDMQWFTESVVNDPVVYRMLLVLHRQTFLAEQQPLAWHSQWLECMALLFSRYSEMKAPQFDRGLSAIELSYLKDYLMSDLASKHSLDDLAALFDLNHYQFLRRFRASTGMTPHAYLLSLRLDFSRRLLRRGGKVTDVALAAGFYDQSHFIHAFRKANGLVPSRYCQ